MKNYIKKNPALIIALFLGVLLIPNLAFAQITITGMVESVGIVIGNVAVFIVIIFWILTGLLFLSAQGAPEKLTTAKKALFAAIGGTIIIILAKFAAPILWSAITVGA